MINMLIKQKDGYTEVEEDTIGKPYELEWEAAGARCYIRGPFKPLEYDAARNLFLNACIDAHIPARSVRRVKGSRPPRSMKTDTKRMF